MSELATTKDLRAIISGDKFRGQLAMSLPAHMKPERFARIALTALHKTPKLLECTPESVLKCCMDLSTFGLEPDGRRAYLIPYKDECTLIISWMGLVELGKRSGDVSKWVPVTVCEKDEFSWEDGEVHHKINFREDRGSPQCVYSKVTFKDGTSDVEVMTLEECNAIRDRQRSKDSGPWKTDYIQMCLKTAIRRHAKRITLSPELHDALERDDDRFSEIRNVTQQNTPPPPPKLDLPSSERKKKKPEAQVALAPAGIVAEFWQWVEKHGLYEADVLKWLNVKDASEVTDGIAETIDRDEMLADLAV